MNDKALPSKLKSLFQKPGLFLKWLNGQPLRKQVWIVLCLALGFAWLLQAAVVVGKFQGHPTGLFHLGENFYIQGPKDLLAFKPYLHAASRGQDSSGYDGQFFYYLAHDPFLRHGAEHFMDLPRLRARRVGYPLLGWACGFGVPALIPFSLYAVQMACLLGCVALLGLRARGAGLPFCVGLLFVPCASTAMTLYVMTSEIVATFFLFLAMTCFEKRRFAAMLAATLMALLVKEVCLMWLVAIVLYGLYTRHKRILVGCAVVLLAWAGWIGYVGWTLKPPVSPKGLEAVKEIDPPIRMTSPGEEPPPPLPPPTGETGESEGKISILRHRFGYFSLPFTGAVEHLKRRSRGEVHPDRSFGFRLGELGLMVTLLAMGLRGVVRFRRKSLRDPAAILFALAGLCAISMKADIWWWSGNYARQFFILLAPALWFLPRGFASRGDLYGHVGFSLWKLFVRFVPFL